MQGFIYHAGRPGCLEFHLQRVEIKLLVVTLVFKFIVWLRFLKHAPIAVLSSDATAPPLNFFE